MISQKFNSKWTVRKDVPLFGRRAEKPVILEVDLPYDAMIHEEKREDTASKNRTGHYPEGRWVYLKKFIPDETWKDKYVAVHFEGVYMNTSVYINEDRVAFVPNGYTDFVVDLTPYLRMGEVNELRVACKTYHDSRWYSGAGIYRDVNLYVADLVHIPHDGLMIHTDKVDNGRAEVIVSTEVTNGRHRAALTRVDLTLIDPAGKVVGRYTAPLTVLPGKTQVLRARMSVADPDLWCPENPALYHCTAVVSENGAEIDRFEDDFGIRILGLDVNTGFTINGKVYNLRGGCIHHDNGVVGGATFSSMEERRVRLMKEAGFNAIRMSHHPASRAMMRACDRAGMLLMDEFSDMWTKNKNYYDYSMHFDTQWEADITSMVRKDYNRPSVVLYSIGNEIPETGSPFGAGVGRMLAEKIRSLDPHRYITNAINAMLAMGEGLSRMTRLDGDVNEIINRIGWNLDAMVTHHTVGELTEESYAAVDIAGYNYMQDRYEMDHELYPNRIILGTETFPKAIAFDWNLVEKCPWVIGDFIWIGWDHLGECGTFPSSLNTGGTLNLAGIRRPSSYYRDIIFGLTQKPGLAVYRPGSTPADATRSMWGWTDTLDGWSWYGHEGETMLVEVACSGDEAELILNGRSLGRKAPGGGMARMAIFEVPFEPGELTAVSYREGKEIGRRSLLSPRGDVRLTAAAEDTSMLEKPDELIFIQVAFADSEGRVFHNVDGKVMLTVEGDAELQGFGNADGRSPEGFVSAEHLTYEGRAFCVLRRTGAGSVRATFACEGYDPAVVEIRPK